MEERRPANKLMTRRFGELNHPRTAQSKYCTGLPIASATSRRNSAARPRDGALFERFECRLLRAAESVLAQTRLPTEPQQRFFFRTQPVKILSPGDSISITALSASISRRGSPLATISPSCFSQEITLSRLLGHFESGHNADRHSLIRMNPICG